MEKLKGGSEEEDQLGNVPQYLSPEDAALLSLPEHLRSVPQCAALVTPAHVGKTPCSPQLKKYLNYYIIYSSVQR